MNIIKQIKQNQNRFIRSGDTIPQKDNTHQTKSNRVLYFRNL